MSLTLHGSSQSWIIWTLFEAIVRPSGREHVPEVFTGSDVEFAFICMGEKAFSAESAEYFPDMSYVLRKVIGIDQYVIQIDNDIAVYDIHKDVIHEPLKSCGSIGKAFWHY